MSYPGWPLVASLCWKQVHPVQLLHTWCLVKRIITPRFHEVSAFWAHVLDRKEQWTTGTEKMMLYWWVLLLALSAAQSLWKLVQLSVRRMCTPATAMGPPRNTAIAGCLTQWVLSLQWISSLLSALLVSPCAVVLCLLSLRSFGLFIREHRVAAEFCHTFCICVFIVCEFLHTL